MSDEKKPVDISILPCCGAKGVNAKPYDKTVANALDSAWYCGVCGKDIPDDFLAEVRKVYGEEQEKLAAKIKADNPGEDIGLRVVVKPKEKPPPPEDPKFKRLTTTYDIFHAGRASASDPYALCPYDQSTEAYKHWNRGRDFGLRTQPSKIRISES